MNPEKRLIRLNGNICGVRGIWLNGFSFFNTYSYVLCPDDNNEVLLVDTCGPGSGMFIKHAVESMGRSMSDVTGVALTHWHKDHTGSLAEIIHMTGGSDKPLNIFIHKNDAPFLISGKTRLLTVHPQLKLKIPHGPGRLPGKNSYRLVELDHQSGENPLSAYGVEFIHTPGHTPGHTSYIHRKSMSLFSGCALSLFGKNTVGIVPVFHDREKQVESAEKLADMEFTSLYPAHLNLRNDEIKREMRAPFRGRLKPADRITGTLPVFRYPRW